MLEVGAGGAQGARWLARQGAEAVALDLSHAMLAHALGRSPAPCPWCRPTPPRLPLADASFDLAFSAYGALPFVADVAPVLAEVARVLRPGGRWVFSVTHPVRWAFPDAPGPEGLVADRSYFDRTPYVERDGVGHGHLRRAPPHARRHRARARRGGPAWSRTSSSPSGPSATTQTWGGWSPPRGRILPGTAIWITVRT